jgi:hypothetical protein
VEEVVAEVERCFRDYGGKKGYIFVPLLILAEGTENMMEKNVAIVKTDGLPAACAAKQKSPDRMSFIKGSCLKSG